MERDALLTLTLDDGLYEAPLLEGVRLEEGDHAVVGRWTYRHADVARRHATLQMRLGYEA